MWIPHIGLKENIEIATTDLRWSWEIMKANSSSHVTVSQTQRIKAIEICNCKGLDSVSKESSII